MPTAFEPLEPETVVLPADAFDALLGWLSTECGYDHKVARVLSKPAPWDAPNDWEI